MISGRSASVDRPGLAASMAYGTAMALLVVASSCAGDRSDPEVTAGIVVRDSAGIEIVESASPLLPPDQGWTIDSVPFLEIGAVEGADEAYLLSRPQQVRRLPDGGIVLVEGQTREIRVYGPDGVHRTSFGGDGEGPGEFAASPILASPVTDTLVAWDPGAGRMSWFLLDGTLVRDRALANEVMESNEIELRRAENPTLLAGGGMVGGLPLQSESGRASQPPVLTSYINPFLVNVGSGSALLGDTLPRGRTATGPTAMGMRIIMQDAWAPSATFAPGTAELPLVVGDPMRAELTWFDRNLVPLRKARIATPVVLITEADRAAQLAELQEAWGEMATPQEVASPVERLWTQDTLPRITVLRRDVVGNTWVTRRVADADAEPPVHDVLDPEGRWLTTVVRPEAVPPFEEVGADYVLSVWRSELDVPFVRAYRLRRPG